jgi:hypothetical protein
MEPVGGLMNYAFYANLASLFFGFLSAIFWVLAAVVKAPPPAGYEGVKNANTFKATIVDGGELYGTLRLQAKWNSRAAFSAAAAASFLILSSLLV